VRVFINGRQDNAAKAGSIAIQTTSQPVWIGQTEQGPLRGIRFDGRIDEVRISNVARAYIALGDTPTAVLGGGTTARPEHSSLAQNYPNPFNGETSVSLALAQAALTELAVFDLAGQRVATLVRGQYGPGAYTVRWDGQDDAGRPLASGVYVYRLQSKVCHETRKLTILR
jgi:hypothetical protein